MKIKENNELGLMIVFLSPFLLQFIVRNAYVRAFSRFNMMGGISSEAFDQIRFFIETGINIFFGVLYVYIGSLYYIMRKRKSDKST